MIGSCNMQRNLASIKERCEHISSVQMLFCTYVPMLCMISPFYNRIGHYLENFDNMKFEANMSYYQEDDFQRIHYITLPSNEVAVQKNFDRV